MKLLTTYFLLPTIFFLLLAGPIFAQSGAPGVNLTIEMVITALQNLACWFFRVGALLVFIMLIVYGLMILFSGGDSSKFQEGKKALWWGIIGAFIVLGVYVIIITVAALVGAATPPLLNC